MGPITLVALTAHHIPTLMYRNDTWEYLSTSIRYVTYLHGQSSETFEIISKRIDFVITH